MFGIYFLPKLNQNDSQSITKKLTGESQTEAKFTNIPYTVTKNYFVKNTVKTLDNPKTESAEKFNEIFGMATRMQKDGKPPPIDFTKQHVFAVVLSKTDSAKTIEPASLQKNERGDVILNYKIVVGQQAIFFNYPKLGNYC